MKLTELAKSKGTYAAVKLSKTSQDALHQYAVDNKIPNPIPKEKMHITLLYSRRSCPNYVPRGQIDPPMIATVKDRDVFLSRPDADDATRCLVLKLDCLELFNRHLELMNEHNATYDFPLYTPHVSLSYDIGDLDYLTLPMFEGELEIVEEYAKDLDLD